MFVLARRGVGANGHMPLAERDEIEFPSLPSLRILKEFIKRRVAAIFTRCSFVCSQRPVRCLRQSSIRMDLSAPLTMPED